MTDEQKAVFEAVSRGRLIFPFRGEREHLLDQAKAGPLASFEKARLEKIEAAYAKVRNQDERFHSAMVAGDIEGAGRIAEEALKTLESLA